MAQKRKSVSREVRKVSRRITLHNAISTSSDEFIWRHAQYWRTSRETDFPLMGSKNNFCEIHISRPTTLLSLSVPHFLLTQLNQLRKLSLKKIQDWTRFVPMTSAIPVQRCTNWAIKPTGSWSFSAFTEWPSPSWLDGSIGRALHRYRRGLGFESRSSLNFFFQA